MDSELQRVVEIVKTVGELDQLGPADDFYKAGIDSMKAMDVMLDLENEFGVSVPDDQFVKARTPEALYAMIEQLRGA